MCPGHNRMRACPCPCPCPSWRGAACGHAPYLAGGSQRSRGWPKPWCCSCSLTPPHTRPLKRHVCAHRAAVAGWGTSCRMPNTVPNVEFVCTARPFQRRLVGDGRAPRRDASSLLTGSTLHARRRGTSSAWRWRCSSLAFEPEDICWECAGEHGRVSASHHRDCITPC